MKQANTRASALMDSDSESIDRFHRVTGRAVAKASSNQVATTRRHPRGTSRPTVQASTPQARAAMAAWVARRVDEVPTSLMSRGVNGGR
jgi:hypothetical protein